MCPTHSENPRCAWLGSVMLCNVLDRTLMLALLLFLWHRYHRHSNIDSHFLLFSPWAPLTWRWHCFSWRLDLVPQSILGNLSTPELHPRILQVFWNYSALCLFISYTYYILCFCMVAFFWVRTHACVEDKGQLFWVSPPHLSVGVGISGCQTLAASTVSYWAILLALCCWTLWQCSLVWCLLL